MTMLVDAGVGCSRTLASDVFQVVGSRPPQLARLGLAPEAVDAVPFTHLREDHLGWSDDPDTGEPTFAKARYLVYRGEWQAKHSGQGTAARVMQALDPIDERGAVEYH